MRIRTIRPEFWESPQVGALGVSARLTFIGLWNLADREGRLKDRPEHIAIKLFPYDRVKPSRVDAWLGELARAGLIIRYHRGGEAYLAIPTWQRHQRPHPHEAPSEIPPPPTDEESSTSHQDSEFRSRAGAEMTGGESNAERSRPPLLLRANSTHGLPRTVRPALCRATARTENPSFKPAVTFNGAPRHREPSPSCVNLRSINHHQETDHPGSPGFSDQAADLGAQAMSGRELVPARETGLREALSRNAPATPAKEGGWDEQDAWLRRFLSAEQKAFVGAHLEPLLADYAFWCRLSEAAGGLSREFLEVEFAKMALWLGEHPTRGPTACGVKRFVARWIERAAEQIERRSRVAS
jgi:hypothetical protein